MVTIARRAKITNFSAAIHKSCLYSWKLFSDEFDLTSTRSPLPSRIHYFGTQFDSRNAWWSIRVTFSICRARVCKRDNGKEIKWTVTQDYATRSNLKWIFIENCSFWNLINFLSNLIFIFLPHNSLLSRCGLDQIKICSRFYPSTAAAQNTSTHSISGENV